MKAAVLGRESLELPVRNIKETNALDLVPPLGLHAKRFCPLLEFTALELPLDAGTSFFKD